ncbi:rSAM-modified peptide [Parabacteroides distasonis]|uniref:RSAM-modified peptide n=1 Tax=Parabacteroides distasonis TaxID=823 RepID=A0A3L7ZPM0_PARDI|nr:rSAM-modified peptide [Parabacteroides distasonis]RLT72000.1 rSAM-modified peptide [Parabacteroides distasonis]
MTKVLTKLSLREDARVLTPKEMKSLKGGSVSCKCEGNPDPYFKPNCDACKEGCGGPYICVG